MNIEGQRFGRLVVRDRVRVDKHRNIIWSCLCDCGNYVNLRTNTLCMGLVVSCGCYQREKAREKMLGSKNPMWKGDNVSVQTLHAWVRYRKLKPELCERCGDNKPQDLANVSQEYKRDVNDYEWLCRRCHMNDDGRMEARKTNGQFSSVYAFRVDE